MNAFKVVGLIFIVLGMMLTLYTGFNIISIFICLIGGILMGIRQKKAT